MRLYLRGWCGRRRHGHGWSAWRSLNGLRYWRRLAAGDKRHATHDDGGTCYADAGAGYKVAPRYNWTGAFRSAVIRFKR